MTYNPNIHHRRSIRLKGYDYSKEGLYFITIVCQNYHHLFGKIQNGIMCINIFGNIAYQEWIKTPLIRPNISLHAFIVMPNHIHGILEIKKWKGEKNKGSIGKFKSPSQTIGAIIRGYKGSVTKKIKIYNRGELIFDQAKNKGKDKLQFAPTELINFNKSIWQRDYYDIIIRNETSLKNISNYIISNPVNWKKDKFNKQ